MELAPLVSAAYGHLAGVDDAVTLVVPAVVGRGPWQTPSRRRGPRTSGARSPRCGPHRDELEIVIGGGDRPGPTRPRASNAAWRWPCAWPPTNFADVEPAEPPVLLLDDVFSELDARRSAALVEQLPAGQVLLTTAVDPPPR